jgi:hypothetical protein
MFILQMVLTLFRLKLKAHKKLAQNKNILYASQERVLHIQEILRLAELHFTRLRKQTELTQADYDELEKWIRRAKSSDGLKSIVLALQEIAKYRSYDIKLNLYALVQKIIIEGPNQSKKLIKS